MGLSASEMARYDRHLTLPEVGVAGQEKLKSARVLVVGTGGLGSPLSLYLAAAGVGTLGLVDFDLVDESNLQRQVIFGTSQIGRSKVQSAKARLLDLNPEIHIELHELRLDSSNALNIVQQYDLVADGTDNFSTRYLINDACVLSKVPNVYGSIYRFQGQVSVFDPSGGGPCYRCLYPAPPPPHLVPSCAEGGVLGVLPGVVGSLQATEAVKLILEIGQSLRGRLLTFDALDSSFRVLGIPRSPDCPLCGTAPSIKELIDYDQFCGLPARGEGHTVSCKELWVEWGEGRRPALIDVREPEEWAQGNLESHGAFLLPLARLQEISAIHEPNDELVVYCKSGARSRVAQATLQKLGFTRVRSLEGGILAWHQREGDF